MFCMFCVANTTSIVSPKGNAVISMYSTFKSAASSTLESYTQSKKQNRRSEIHAPGCLCTLCVYMYYVMYTYLYEFMKAVFCSPRAILPKVSPLQEHFVCKDKNRLQAVLVNFSTSTRAALVIISFLGEFHGDNTTNPRIMSKNTTTQKTGVFPKRCAHSMPIHANTRKRARKKSTPHRWFVKFRSCLAKFRPNPYYFACIRHQSFSKAA